MFRKMINNYRMMLKKVARKVFKKETVIEEEMTISTRTISAEEADAALKGAISTIEAYIPKVTNVVTLEEALGMSDDD